MGKDDKTRKIRETLDSELRSDAMSLLAGLSKVPYAVLRRQVTETICSNHWMMEEQSDDKD